MERHAARLFGNGARPSGLLSLKGVVSPDALTKAKAAWQAAHGGNNSGGTAVVPAEAEWQALTLTSVDAQFMEMRRFAINEIARVFGVPPHMLFEMERVIKSSADNGPGMHSYSLMSWIKRWEGEIRLKLFSPDDRKTYLAEFLTDDFARADLASRTESYRKAIAARIINPNEARAADNHPPYAGWRQVRKSEHNPAGTPSAQNHSPSREAETPIRRLASFRRRDRWRGITRTQLCLPRRVRRRPTKRQLQACAGATNTGLNLSGDMNLVNELRLGLAD